MKRGCKAHPEVAASKHWGCPDCLFLCRKEAERLRAALDRIAVGSSAEAAAIARAALERRL